MRDSTIGKYSDLSLSDIRYLVRVSNGIKKTTMYKMGSRGELGTVDQPFSVDTLKKLPLKLSLCIDGKIRKELFGEKLEITLPDRSPISDILTIGTNYIILSGRGDLWEFSPIVMVKRGISKEPLTKIDTKIKRIFPYTNNYPLISINDNGEAHIYSHSSYKKERLPKFDRMISIAIDKDMLFFVTENGDLLVQHLRLKESIATKILGIDNVSLISSFETNIPLCITLDGGIYVLDFGSVKRRCSEEQQPEKIVKVGELRNVVQVTKASIFKNAMMLRTVGGDLFYVIERRGIYLLKKMIGIADVVDINGTSIIAIS